MPTRHPRRTPVAACALVLITALAACGDADAEPDTSAGGAGSVELVNCDHTVTVEQTPERVVSLNQGSTEVLLSLGLADRLVGTATWTDPVLESLEEANADVPRLADNAPSFEVVLEAEPDFVTASFTSTLAEGGVATREQLEELGVGTYVAPTSCTGKSVVSADGARDTPFEIEQVYAEITDLAEIFGVEQRGEELVADLEERLDRASETDAGGATAMFWFANAESPYLAGCCGAPGLIADELGLVNVFADESDEWPQINWETVAERDPDVLVIGDLTRKSQTAETAVAKIGFLESHPVTRELAAVRNGSYVIVSGAEMNPSLRTVYGVENVGDQLRELGLAD